MSRTLRALGATLAMVLATAGLASCSSTKADPPPPLPACTPELCSGVINNAKFKIMTPDNWNGSLLIYSHGYRLPVPVKFQGLNYKVSRKPEPAPGWSIGKPQIANKLLAKGYALAGSSYSSNGWAVEDGVRAAEELHSYFTEKFAEPQRVYVWGDSLGGLITTEVAERHPDWVTAAAPLCGVLAGVVPNMDIAMDITYAVKTLINPKLRDDGYPTLQAARRALIQTSSIALEKAKTEPAILPYIAALGDGPDQTKRFDGVTPISRLSAYGESLAVALVFGTISRTEVDQRFGGNISGNVGVNYSARITPEEEAYINALDSKATSKFNRLMAAGKRTAADPAARAKAIAVGGNPNGDIKVPFFTLHTSDDPVVIAQNESFFRQRYESGPKDAGLVQAFTVPPTTYPQDPGAPYGAGHCEFTPESRIGAIDVIDTWVRTGKEPSTKEINNLLGSPSGYQPNYTPGPWPGEQSVIAEVSSSVSR